MNLLISGQKLVKISHRVQPLFVMRYASFHIKAQPWLMLVLWPFELEDHIECSFHLNSRHIENRCVLGPGVHCIERSLPERLRQAH
jgi:hypothetical protein